MQYKILRKDEEHLMNLLRDNWLSLTELEEILGCSRSTLVSTITRLTFLCLITEENVNGNCTKYKILTEGDYVSL